MYICFLKVPVGAMPESFDGEYNRLFGDILWEDPHCCTAYTQAESLNKDAPKEHKPLSRTYSGSGSAGKLLFIMLLCNLMFSFGLYLSLRRLVHCIIMKWCASCYG